MSTSNRIFHESTLATKRQALRQTGGHQTRAARILGVNVTTLSSKIKRYRIDPLEYCTDKAKDR